MLRRLLSSTPPLSVVQPSPFISGCLLAGCCLSVVAGGTLGCSSQLELFALWCSHDGKGVSSLSPRPSVSWTPISPIPPPSFLPPHHAPLLLLICLLLGGVSLHLGNNYCPDGGLKELPSFHNSEPGTDMLASHPDYEDDVHLW